MSQIVHLLKKSGGTITCLPEHLSPGLNELFQHAFKDLYAPRSSKQIEDAINRYYDDHAVLDDTICWTWHKWGIWGLFWYMILADGEVHAKLITTTLEPSASRFGDEDVFIMAIDHLWVFQKWAKLIFPIPLFSPFKLTTYMTVRARDTKVLELKDRFHNLPVWPWVIRAPFGLTGSLGPLAWQFVLLPAIFGKGL
eukprot:jgi/Chrzof1/284/Cz01g09270.t1